MMSKDLQTKVADYYTKRIKLYGCTPRGVDWNSSSSQLLRFDKLTSIINKKNDHFSLLDYGCGYGALYMFLAGRYEDFEYLGYDLSDEMVRAATENIRDTSAEFTSSYEFTVSDYTIASGIFNVKLDIQNEEWLSYVLETLNKFDSISSEGFSFNMLTIYSDKDKMKDNLYYADPSFIFNYCKEKFSKYVALLHDYPLYEFTVLVKKNV